MSCNFFGIDVAETNNGFSVFNGREVVFSKTIKTPKHYKVSSITKNLFQKKEVSMLIDKYKPVAAALEAPSFGRVDLAVSIGMIHSTLINIFIEKGIPFLWVPPTKVRFAFLSTGRASKKEGIDYVLKNFKFLDRAKSFDDNMADATMLSYLAYLFFNILNKNNSHSNDSIFISRKDKLRHIFNSKAKNKQGKMAGLIKRPFQFYWEPGLNLEE